MLHDKKEVMKIEMVFLEEFLLKALILMKLILMKFKLPQKELILNVEKFLIENPHMLYTKKN